MGDRSAAGVVRRTVYGHFLALDLVRTSERPPEMTAVLGRVSASDQNRTRRGSNYRPRLAGGHRYRCCWAAPGEYGEAIQACSASDELLATRETGQDSDVFAQHLPQASSQVAYGVVFTSRTVTFERPLGARERRSRSLLMLGVPETRQSSRGRPALTAALESPDSPVRTRHRHQHPARMR